MIGDLAVPRELPHTCKGVPATGARTVSRLRRITAALFIGVLGSTLLIQTAQADDLTDRRDWVNRKIDQTKRDLSESGDKLSAAAEALEKSQAALSAAKAALQKTREELAAAKTYDEQMKAKLAEEQKKLKAAKIAVAKGQKNVDAEKALIGEVVREQYQQQTNLAGVSIMLTSESQADVQTRMQWSTTMFDSSAADMARLKKLQKKLKAAKAKQAEIEKTVAADRQAAADNLVRKQSLKTAASNQASAIAALVLKNESATDAAGEQVDADKKQYSELSAERGSVEQRIAERIAKAEAKAKAEAAAERRAREAAAAQARVAAQKASAAKAAQKAAAAKAASAVKNSARAKSSATSVKKSAKAAQKRVKAAPKSAKAAKKSARKAVRASKKSYAKAARVATKRAGRSQNLSYPVSSYITSKYGMRFHPVLKYWKLHDGTDFAASCGTPIRAAASGTVTERYFNAGYGNRLLIDHGKVGGDYLTTAYNHAIRYTVGVGERVSKGEVIGYAGTTGYSTGCHLHLMAWKNGTLVNPTSLF